jgi:hypothetical protein
MWVKGVGVIDDICICDINGVESILYLGVKK